MKKAAGQFWRQWQEFAGPAEISSIFNCGLWIARCSRCGMLEKTEALRARCRRFAVRVLEFVRKLPRDPVGDTVARQLARAGTGASANYHSACRARSRAEFISRMRQAVDEADEAWHWIELLRGNQAVFGPEADWLLQESIELRAIFSKSMSTARANQTKSRI